MGLATVGAREWRIWRPELMQMSKAETDHPAAKTGPVAPCCGELTLSLEPDRLPAALKVAGERSHRAALARFFEGVKSSMILHKDQKKSKSQ